MTKILTSFLLALFAIVATPVAMAQLKVFACEPEWASLAKELGGEKISVYSATTAFQDPHRVEARPSLIAKVRRSNLLVCSGAELEAGWLPMLLRQAGNKALLKGNPGHFMASDQVQRMEIPQILDRAMGDVHASGNPHVHLDPRRLLTIADTLQQRLQKLDFSNAAYYTNRYNKFAQRWQSATARWLQQAKPLKGQRIAVLHADWVYFFDWLGIENAGTLEPKPGLPTTASHLANLKKQLGSKPARMIIHTTYQNPRAARRLAKILNIPVVELPYTVGGAKEASDLFKLFEVTLTRMLAVM